jgi:hypothetical protein
MGIDILAQELQDLFHHLPKVFILGNKVINGFDQVFYQAVVLQLVMRYQVQDTGKTLDIGPEVAYP